VVHFSFLSKGSITPEVILGLPANLACVYEILHFWPSRFIHDVIELATFQFVGTCQKTKRREHFRRLCAA